MWITVEQANTYFTDSTQWSEVDNKAEVLRQASDRLDGLVFYEEDYHRTGPKFTDGDVTGMTNAGMPQRLRSAVAELALHYALFPRSVIDSEDISTLEPTSNEVADLPLFIQNLVTPFLYSAEVNEPVVDKLDRQERQKSKGLSFASDPSSSSSSQSTTSQGGAGLDTAAVRALLEELGYVDQTALDAAIAAIPGIETGGLNEAQVRTLITSFGFVNETAINTAIANAIDNSEHVTDVSLQINTEENSISVINRLAGAADVTDKVFLPAQGDAGVQADFNETDDTEYSFIKNKPPEHRYVPSGGAITQVLTKTGAETQDWRTLPAATEGATSQIYNLYISNDTSNDAQEGTFPVSEVTNYFPGFMNFTQTANGTVRNPLTEVSAVTLIASDGNTTWPNIENVTSDGAITLHAGVPIHIKASGGINLRATTGLPSGVVLAQVTRRVLLNDVAISSEQTGTFRIRAGYVFIPLDGLSYDFIPPVDLPYSGSHVEYDIEFYNATGRITNDITIAYWIEPDTKEVVTQLNPQVVGGGGGGGVTAQQVQDAIDGSGHTSVADVNTALQEFGAITGITGNEPILVTGSGGTKAISAHTATVARHGTTQYANEEVTAAGVHQGLSVTPHGLDAVLDTRGLPTGGTEDQVLVKSSDTSYETEWVTGGAGVTAQQVQDLIEASDPITRAELDSTIANIPPTGGFATVDLLNEVNITEEFRSRNWFDTGLVITEAEWTGWWLLRTRKHAEWYAINVDELYAFELGGGPALTVPGTNTNAMPIGSIGTTTFIAWGLEFSHSDERPAFTPSNPRLLMIGNSNSTARYEVSLKRLVPAVGAPALTETEVLAVLERDNYATDADIETAISNLPVHTGGGIDTLTGNEPILVTGTGHSRAISVHSATIARHGTVELATTQQTAAGVDQSRAVTPHGLDAVLDTRGIPAGGLEGYHLVKRTDASYELEWQAPGGGSEDAVTTDQLIAAIAAVRQVTEGGEANQVLTKKPIGYGWEAPPEAGGGGGGELFAENYLLGDIFHGSVTSSPNRMTAAGVVQTGENITGWAMALFQYNENLTECRPGTWHLFSLDMLFDGQTFLASVSNQAVGRNYAMCFPIPGGNTAFIGRTANNTLVIGSSLGGEMSATIKKFNRGG